VTLAPIILFVYNRPQETLRTLTLLSKNQLAKQSRLYIFSDGPRDEEQISKVNYVRKIISNLEGFKEVTIIKSEVNKGLGKSIIDGVSSIIQEHGKVIVLEDDLETSEHFLTFMNDALNFYEANNSIWSISGYTPEMKFPENYDKEVYGVMRACSWGWATWHDRWEQNNWELDDKIYDLINNKVAKKDFEKPGNDMTYMLLDQKKGAIDSWAIRWCYNQYLNNSITIYPKKSYVNNIGFSGESTHGSISKKYNTQVSKVYNTKFSNVKQENLIVNEYAKFYNMTTINYLGRLLKYLGIYKKIKLIMKKLRR
jgi:hypothetical protein